MAKHENASAEDATETAFSAPKSLRSGELELATVTAIHADGRVDLRFVAGEQAKRALSTVALSKQDVGRQVAVMTLQNDERNVVVIGLIKSQLDSLLEQIEIASTHSERADEDQEALSGALTEAPQEDTSLEDQSVKVDGKRVVLTGDEEVVLKCGEASITLTKSGKIMIRGKYLLNRSSGINRIMGGSVQVN